MSMSWEEAIKYFKMKISANEIIGNNFGAEYEAYKIALTALTQPNEPLTCDGCYWQSHGSIGKCVDCIREKHDNYYLRPLKGDEDTMDIEKLIERLREKEFARDYDCTPFECGVFALLDDAATALSTLQEKLEEMTNRNDENLGMCRILGRRYQEFQAENEKLRAELEQVKRERDAAVEDVLDAAITPCSYCERNPINGGNCDMDNETHEMYSCWKWYSKWD